MSDPIVLKAPFKDLTELERELLNKLEKYRVALDQIARIEKVGYGECRKARLLAQKTLGIRPRRKNAF